MYCVYVQESIQLSIWTVHTVITIASWASIHTVQGKLTRSALTAVVIMAYGPLTNIPVMIISTIEYMYTWAIGYFILLSTIKASWQELSTAPNVASTYGPRTLHTVYKWMHWVWGGLLGGMKIIWCHTEFFLGKQL